MPSRFELPHLDISAFKVDNNYQGSGSAVNSGADRVRAEHGRRLANELDAAFAAADELRPRDERIEAVEGSFIEVELRAGAKVDILERKQLKVRPGAVTLKEGNKRNIALFVPDHARVALQKILNDYQNGPLTPIAQEPPHKPNVEPIEAFRFARLETFWTDDPAALPRDARHEMWWALWCWPDGEATIENVCDRLQVRPASRDRRLYFPEATVIPVYASRAAIELMLFATGVIAELRRADDNPAFFTDDAFEEQVEWTEDLAARITWPGPDAPSICILDTGINRGHMLIQPALAGDDLHAIIEDWGLDDHHATGHGTAMAGLALHGDLTAQLADAAERILAHRLESVKLLPPDGFEKADPDSYGAITQQAISLPEIAAPDRSRVYCMAISNQNVSGAFPTSWSAAIDQAAAGVMAGDEEPGPRRLIVVSAGNIEPIIDAARILPQDGYPAEDPSQAWNALTVGGYTDLNEIRHKGYEDWVPLAPVGGLSPHSRTSVIWPQGQAPIKPEIVMEAGNRAKSPGGREVLTFSALSVLSTGRSMAEPLVPFQATSAATAQAARLAARISGAHPNFWPETVRGLIVHSAEWTSEMLRAFDSSPGKRGNYEIVRRFGYGVPDYDRASASAKDHLALFSQAEIQPFKLQGQRKFNECHYYELPLPNAVLEQLENELVELKVTLSYFIEPNPGLSANIDPQRYQSHGLRFDLRRKGESVTGFKKRVNAFERNDPRTSVNADPDDNRWVLGPKAVSCGSLHCDVWIGPAIELLGRDMLCIKPVNGWWRNRASREICNKKTRYSLIVTMKTRSAELEVDLYTPIKAAIDIKTAVEIEVPVPR